MKKFEKNSQKKHGGPKLQSPRFQAQDERKGQVFIKNPHSILPAIHARPEDIKELIAPRSGGDSDWETLIQIAKKKGIPVIEGDAPSAGGKGSDRGREGSQKEFRLSEHGAWVKQKAPISVEALSELVDSENPGVFLALDSLTDPQNVGAIFRAAAFFGVKGILMTEERSAPMTSTVYNIASGGVEAVPFASVINLQRGFEKMKLKDIWILGTSEHAKQGLKSVSLDRNWLVVLGNEEKGMRRLTTEACDVTVSIPSKGKIVTSLNVAVANGIILSHLS